MQRIQFMEGVLPPAQYIDVLIEQGYSVAIAEQMKTPKSQASKREVVQVIGWGWWNSTKPDSENNFQLLWIGQEMSISCLPVGARKRTKTRCACHGRRRP